MLQVKICGLTRCEDIEYVNDALPDFVGFVFALSKRQINIKHAQELNFNLDKRIKKVGVFANQEETFVRQAADQLYLDIIQFHGDETVEYINKFKGYKIWKAIGISNTEDAESAGRFDVDGILLDSRIDGRFGGSGGNFDWGIIKDFSFNKPIILAGGLNIENINDAIDIVNPQVIDISTGVETNGVKDYEKIDKFIKKVRKY